MFKKLYNIEYYRQQENLCNHFRRIWQNGRRLFLYIIEERLLKDYIRKIHREGLGCLDVYKRQAFPKNCSSGYSPMKMSSKRSIAVKKSAIRGISTAHGSPKKGWRRRSLRRFCKPCQINWLSAAPVPTERCRRFHFQIQMAWIMRSATIRSMTLRWTWKALAWRFIRVMSAPIIRPTAIRRYLSSPRMERKKKMCIRDRQIISRCGNIPEQMPLASLWLQHPEGICHTLLARPADREFHYHDWQAQHQQKE